MKSYKLFEKTYNIDINNLYDKSLDETEQELKDLIIRKKHHLKKNYDEFSRNLKTNKKNIEGYRNNNSGEIAEEIVRTVFKGINLNVMTKNNPYIDVYTEKGIPGITQPGELISVKSTNNFKSVKNLVSDTKSIKLDALLTYFVFKNYNYRTSLNINKIIVDMFMYYDKQIVDLDENYKNQKNYKNIIYLILNRSISREIHVNTIEKDIDNYISNISDNPGDAYDENIEYIISKIRKDETPVSLAICYSENEIFKINKTNTIGLGNLLLNTIDIWEDNNWIIKKYFNAYDTEDGKVDKVYKYLSLDDLKKVHGIIAESEIFPVKINIDLSKDDTDYDTEHKSGSKRKRLFISTELVDANFDKEHENEILDTIDRIIQILEKNPEKLNDIKRSL